MKKCELCKFPAKTYCESDEAHLCWSCDAQVHGANFLVARHTRTLLCRSCQSLTPWKASGPNLGRTLCVCDGCATRRNFKHHQNDESEADNEDFTAADAGAAQNQAAVPCSSTSAPPAPTSSSTSSSSCTSNGMKSVKRTRESSCSIDLNMTPFQKNDINHSFSRRPCCHRRRRSKIRNSGGGGSGGDGDAISSPLKKQQIETDRSIPVKGEPRCDTITNSGKRFDQSLNL